MVKIGTEQINYECKENDNHIRLLFNDSELDELHFSDCLKRSWTVIGITDLTEALALGDIKRGGE